eukprot:gene16138-21935_t
MLLVIGEGKDEGVPHMKMIQKLMSSGVKTIDQIHGMCFKRIIWGHGPHVMYVDTLSKLRRMTAYFARKFVMSSYSTPIPSEFLQKEKKLLLTNVIRKDNIESMLGNNQSISSLDPKIVREINRTSSTDNYNNLLINNNKPLAVVVYTRGNTGKGRTMRDENKLVDRLQLAGANVIFCCDFSKVSLDQQLAYAIHADVILIGVFGSLQASTPYLGGILGVIIATWIGAAQSLNKQFKAKEEEMYRKDWPLQDFEKKEQ